MAITRIFVHHTYTDPNKTVESLREDAIKAAYKDIPYHGLIYTSGAFFPGRPYEMISAAQGDLSINRSALAVALVGDFETNEIDPNGPMFKQLVQVCAIWCKRHGLTEKAIFGHYQAEKLVNKPRIATKCPGKNMIKLLPLLKRTVATYL